MLRTQQLHSVSHKSASLGCTLRAQDWPHEETYEVQIPYRNGLKQKQEKRVISTDFVSFLPVRHQFFFLFTPVIDSCAAGSTDAPRALQHVA